MCHGVLGRGVSGSAWVKGGRGVKGGREVARVKASQVWGACQVRRVGGVSKVGVGTGCAAGEGCPWRGRTCARSRRMAPPQAGASQGAKKSGCNCNCFPTAESFANSVYAVTRVGRCVRWAHCVVRAFISGPLRRGGVTTTALANSWWEYWDSGAGDALKSFPDVASSGISIRLTRVRL